MEENTVTTATTTNNDENTKESPKPLAFTIDLSDGKKTVDTQRYKNLVEKYQKKHRRGQSLTKLESTPPNSIINNKKLPSSVNLPRKFSCQSSEGYFSSSDEKCEKTNRRSTNGNKRSELSLPLKSVLFGDDKIMSQSFPNNSSSRLLFNTKDLIGDPESSSSNSVIELKDISSPELDLISPYSPNKLPVKTKLVRQFSSPTTNSVKETDKELIDNDDDNLFIDGNEFDFNDKSDNVSDAGTYTLDADNYSEEQKARMSIDKEFKIEQISVMKKTEDYIKSLTSYNEELIKSSPKFSNKFPKQTQIQNQKNFTKNNTTKLLSPILSPTQNLSIVENGSGSNDTIELNRSNDEMNKTFTKVMFPSPTRNRCNKLDLDQGSIISVTSSGAFRSKNDQEKLNKRKLSLTKSEVQVEAYVNDRIDFSKTTNLTANLVNIQNISTNPITTNNKLINLPPVIGGYSSSAISTTATLIGNGSGMLSPTKIPSPIHSLTRPRSRNSISSINVDLLSDSSLETESYLKSTQNYINTLQQKLSFDDDENDDDDSDYDTKFNRLKLNNSPHNNLLKQKSTHIRHNSLDERCNKLSQNKLEHFQNKNFLQQQQQQQSIDQTLMFNQYNNKLHKIQNSPNNSPIRRSSSFTNKTNNTTIIITNKNTNIINKNSPQLQKRNQSISRSASTANIKPNYDLLKRRSSISSQSSNQSQQRIDRNQFGDTESSSEEDFDKNLLKKKDLTTTRYNRAFSLRKGRLETSEQHQQQLPKCPNTPEMRRKFQTDHVRTERAISVDRKPIKTNEIQSRYLLNINKKNTILPNKNDGITSNKIVPKVTSTGGITVNNLGLITTRAASTTTPNKNQTFSRTDSGRFSMRAIKPSISANQKNSKRDGSGKKSGSGGGRSNSSLSSREVEFQNWKRRKSYDPMKAAAEGKRKEIAKRQTNNIMTQSCTETNQNQDCDSSPSHSSSVHRSQSFHGTAALEQLLSSEDEEDLTLSADEGFSPPTPSPCELSPTRASLRNIWRQHVLH